MTFRRIFSHSIGFLNISSRFRACGFQNLKVVFQQSSEHARLFLDLLYENTIKAEVSPVVLNCFLSQVRIRNSFLIRAANKIAWDQLSPLVTR